MNELGGLALVSPIVAKLLAPSNDSVQLQNLRKRLPSLKESDKSNLRGSLATLKLFVYEGAVYNAARRIAGVLKSTCFCSSCYAEVLVARQITADLDFLMESAWCVCRQYVCDSWLTQLKW